MLPCSLLVLLSFIPLCLLQPCHRTLAVGLASCLLMHLPEPFKATTFLQPPAAQQGAPAGYTRAPWSVVCLAAMLHRYILPD